MTADLALELPTQHAEARYGLGGSPGEAIAVVGLLPLLLSVAIWNGFPIVYYDTGAYLLEGIGGHFLVERSPVYSLFLRVAGAGTSLWLVVVIQALATAFVMVQAARCLLPALSLRLFLTISAGVGALTGIAWYVGEVEPDCFAAVLVLALFLLAFHAGSLGRTRSAILLCVASVAIAAHPSHLVLAAALGMLLTIYVGVATLSRSWRSRNLRFQPHIVNFRWPRANLCYPASALVMALVLVLAGNYSFTGRIFISRAGPNFLFARLLQDGIVMRLLEDTCPAAGYRLCAYKDDLPPRADAWLWARYSPFFKLGGFSGTREESEQIVLDSLRRYPLLNLQAAIADGARQFISFKTGDQIEPQQWALHSTFSAFTPDQVHAYLVARQQEGRLRFGFLNLVHVPVGYVSLVGLVGLFGYAVWRRQRQAAVFTAFVFVALLANAFICGAISNPHDRYQSRVIWLAPFAILIGGLRLASPELAQPRCAVSLERAAAAPTA